MPVLKDTRETTIIELPGYKESKIEIVGSLLLRDMESVAMKGGEVDLSSAMDTLPKFIIKWNFTNDKDEPLEINKENLGLLSTEAVTFIFEKVNSFRKDQGKD